ncbi:MAG: hypothetical protein PHV17_02140 [Candidatus Omnitrophica bacterium]|nr:hypothetical protein [Candidatus Omnitrophota bacterium]
MPKISSKSLILLIFISIAFAISSAAFYSAIQKPLSLDETDETNMGWQWGHLGPKAFVAQEKGGLGIELSHALLYTFSHALVQLIFGGGHIPLRLYGLFHYLVSFCFLSLIICRLIPDKDHKPFAVITCGLFYFLNPLLLQHSLVVNADNNILTTAILVFLYFFVRFESTELKSPGYYRQRLILAVLLALCFWSKELTPVFLFFGLFVFRLISAKPKRVLSDLVIIGFFGFVIFAFSWWLYCVFTGTDVFGFVKFTIINKSKLAFSQNYFKGIYLKFFAGFRWPIYWVSAQFFIVLISLIFNRIKYFMKNKSLQITDLFLFTGLSIWLPYQFFKPSIDMMKYQYPAYPLFIIFIVYFLTKPGFELWRKIRSGHLIVGLVLLWLLSLHYYVLGDYILNLWQPLSNHLNNHFFIYYFLPSLLVVGIVCLFSSKAKIFSNCLISLSLCVLPVNAGLLLNQAKAEYSTVEIWGNYGESGLAEAINYLSASVTPGSIISVRKDINYYLQYRAKIKLAKNIDPRLILSLKDENASSMLFSKIRIDYLVIDKMTRFISPSPVILSLIGSNFVLDKKAGDFYIYKNKRLYDL